MIIPNKRLSWFRLVFEVQGSTLPRIRARLFSVFLIAVLATLVHHYTGHGSDLTTTPFTLVGLALGVFLGFRNNTAYDRYWEGRRLWGQLVNDARTFTRMTLTLVAADATPHAQLDVAGVKQLQRSLTYHVIAYVHALHMHLRGELDQSAELELALANYGGASQFLRSRNMPNALLLRIGEQVAEARRLGVLRHRDLHLFEQQLTSFTNVQGGCERIKATPIPWSYTLLIHSIVASYCVALPFGLVSTTKLLTPLVVVLISYAFIGLDAVGDEIEEPFGRDDNDLPLATLSRMIEVNLREMLGETDLPALLEPNEDRVLH